jgi:hypothetical protein
MTDSHEAAQMAFGFPISRRSVASVFQRVQRAGRGIATSRAVGGKQTRTTHRKHRRKPRFHHRRTTGIVVPRSMMQALVTVAVVKAISHASS